MSADAVYFRSKVDPIYAGLMIIVCLAMLVGGAVFAESAWSEPKNWDLLAGAILVFLLVGLVAWVFLRTGYRVTRNELVVRFGPLRWRVPLDTIEEVSAAGRWDKGPSLSMDRLNVQYGGKPTGLAISPADREGFLNALNEMAPSLSRTGDRLVRR